MPARLLLTMLVSVPGPVLAPAPSPVPVPVTRPAWVEALPVEPGKLYAIGTADLAGNEGEAIRRASDRARLEVVGRLRATIRGLTSVTTRTLEVQAGDGKLAGPGAAGQGDRFVRDEVRVEIRAEDLPGLAVERTCTDPAGRTAYALACLDLGQARATLAARLQLIRESRIGVGEERSRKARWRLRKLVDDLDRLRGTLDLLAAAGVGGDLRPAVVEERTALGKRLDDLEGRVLPPLDRAKTAVALRTNVDLPAGVLAYLEAQIGACGLLHRELNPDLILDLAFTGGSKGAEFIYAQMDPYDGLNYHLEVAMTLQDREGTALTRPATLQVVQPDSPEGMVNRFRRLFERRLPRLVSEAEAQFQ